MNHLSDFTIGDKVILSRVYDGVLRGQTGVVHKLLKGHNTVRILLPNGDTYDANPYNIDKVEK
jgi:hypothetical protein